MTEAQKIEFQERLVDEMDSNPHNPWVWKWIPFGDGNYQLELKESPKQGTYIAWDWLAVTAHEIFLDDFVSSEDEFLTGTFTTNEKNKVIYIIS